LPQALRKLFDQSSQTITVLYMFGGTKLLRQWGVIHMIDGGVLQCSKDKFNVSPLEVHHKEYPNFCKEVDAELGISIVSFAEDSSLYKDE
jgi:hypothetical protein